MPINKITSSKRARNAIAGVLALAAAIGGMLYSTTDDGRRYPTAVVLSAEKLIKPWEGIVFKSHWDTFGKVWDICYGETKGIKPGMVKTQAECDEMLYRRVYADYYLPLTKCVSNFTEAPISVQASMISGAYNFGVRGWCGSTAAKMVKAKQYRAACERQTAWNKAGGQVLRGLVNRREMGDAQRIGEAELCVSGLDMPVVKSTPKPTPIPVPETPPAPAPQPDGKQGSLIGLGIAIALVGGVFLLVFIRRRRAK